jgi:hypothetical protein
MTKPTFEIEASLPTSEQAALMTNAALGCYVKLMCCAWREGSIPSDIKRIAKLCGEPLHAMELIWEQIQDCFIDDLIRPGRMIHVGLEQQRVAAKAVSQAKSKAGSLGAARRWGPKGAGSQVMAAVPAAAPPAAPLDVTADKVPEAIANSGQDHDAGPAGDPPDGGPQGDLFDVGDGARSAPIQPLKAEGVPPCPQVQIIELYHQLLPTAPKVLTWGEAREALLRQRWREMATTKNAELGNGYKTQADGLAWWSRYFTYVSQSLFLTGRAAAREGGVPFIATLEWLIRPKNFAKVLEGQYNRI